MSVVVALSSTTGSCPPTVVKSAKCLYANPALTEPKKVMEEVEQDFLDCFLEIPDLASREPSPVPPLTPKTSKKCIVLRSVDTKMEREAKQSKRKKRYTNKQTMPKRVILNV